MQRALAFLLVCAGLGVPRAVAQPKDKKDSPGAKEAAEKEAQAKKLFGEAEALYNLGDWEPALALYKQAYLLSQAPALLYNIAQCSRKLGRYEDALTTYRSYLREDPGTPRRANVESLIAEVEAAMAAEKQAASMQSVAKVTISSSPLGAEVRRQGETLEILGVTPLTLEGVKPGAYKFSLLLQGYDPVSFDLNVEGGQSYIVPEAKLSPTPRPDPVWFHRPYIDVFLGSSVSGAQIVNAFPGAGLGASFIGTIGKRGFRYGARVNTAAGDPQGDAGLFSVGVPVGWQFTLPTRGNRLVLAPQVEFGFIAVRNNEIFDTGFYVAGRPGLTLLLGEKRNFFVNPLGFGVGLGKGDDGPVFSAEVLSVGFRYSWKPKDSKKK